MQELEKLRRGGGLGRDLLSRGPSTLENDARGMSKP